MKRYVCIHGHFYQPPRENPWLEAIELQDSAHPYHDWNERVNAECYAPNAAARILDAQGYITKITNNYARMSFNFGPTLLAWMEAADPQTYKSVLEADKQSAQMFSGHGSALAQAYNHMILPLANRRDKRTQVLWGIRDFEHRFGRPPEGMWLPETAVDLESLGIMAELGIRFTILAPHQAKRTRKIGDRAWKDVDEQSLDTAMPYTINLPSGHTMSLFFYNGSVSRAIAFEKLLSRGEAFQKALNGAFPEARAAAQLTHVATDGETYGHHHKYGDMALAYVLENMSQDKSIALTNYGEYLEKHPPTHEAEIRENTSWSCAHGIERWRSDCGCHIGGQPGWNQKWRKPLRDALDWLRDTMIPLYEQECRRLIRDPWRARDDYISVILDRSPGSIARFLGAHSVNSAGDGDRVSVLKLMELQRHALLMFTSCGWFFDDVSGVESTQLLHYAAKCIQLARESTRADLEQTFLRKLESAESNIPEEGNGRRVYERTLKPVTLQDVAVHAAFRALFQRGQDRAQIYCYEVSCAKHEEFGAMGNMAVVGQETVQSQITLERGDFSFAAARTADPEVECGVRRALPDENHDAFITEAKRIWMESRSPATLLERLFPANRASLNTLLRDDRRRILLSLAADAIAETTELHRRLYRERGSLWNLMRENGAPLPDTVRLTAQLALQAEIQTALEDTEIDAAEVNDLVGHAISWGVEAASDDALQRLQVRIAQAAAEWRAAPLELSRMQRLHALIDLAHGEFFKVSVWGAQNVFYDVMHEFTATPRDKQAQSNRPSEEWLSAFTELGLSLGIKAA
jgi:hypothetical protein